MKILLVLLFLFINLFACTRDCLSYHINLKKSLNEEHHKILNSCISCHTKLPTQTVECGGDCFNCHSQNKLIDSNRIEHKTLSSCKKCHINKEDLFRGSNMNNGNMLIDLLKNK